MEKQVATEKVKRGLAQMLKGGAIMDVVAVGRAEMVSEV